MGINSKLDVPGGQVHTYGTQYKTAVDGVKPARSDLRVIMDRNLGATGALYSLSTTNSQNYPTYGLLYQWGRKDPFPKAAAGVSGDKVATQPTYSANGTALANMPQGVQGAVTLETATQNPGIDYYNNNERHDWLSVPNNTLWGDGTTKSVYDPCPEGWRIPPNGTWNDFGTEWNSVFSKNPNWNNVDINISGGLYATGNIKAYYTIPGCYHPISGGLYFVGTSGATWSSTVVTINNLSYFLNLGPTMVSPNYDGYRAHAIGVRCIQE
ncbi:MAG: hypothetical protein K2K83_07140 [Rikenella sp.]|nr:hypothetical protein [Rikenella sp.]